RQQGVALSDVQRSRGRRAGLSVPVGGDQNDDETNEKAMQEHRVCISSSYASRDLAPFLGGASLGADARRQADFHPRVAADNVTAPTHLPREQVRVRPAAL